MSRDDGKLLDAPQDIGPLMKEIHEDLDSEETETIKEALYKMYIKDIKRSATRGFADWYKDRLAKNLLDKS